LVAEEILGKENEEAIVEDSEVHFLLLLWFLFFLSMYNA
jgi:hypothetical protein